MKTKMMLVGLMAASLSACSGIEQDKFYAKLSGHQYIDYAHGELPAPQPYAPQPLQAPRVDPFVADSGPVMHACRTVMEKMVTRYGKAFVCAAWAHTERSGEIKLIDQNGRMVGVLSIAFPDQLDATRFSYRDSEVSNLIQQITYLHIGMTRSEISTYYRSHS